MTRYASIVSCTLLIILGGLLCDKDGLLLCTQYKSTKYKLDRIITRARIIIRSKYITKDDIYTISFNNDQTFSDFNDLWGNKLDYINDNDIYIYSYGNNKINEYGNGDDIISGYKKDKTDIYCKKMYIFYISLIIIAYACISGVCYIRLINVRPYLFILIILLISIYVLFTYNGIDKPYKKIYNDLSSMTIAIYKYLEKFNMLPGDDPNASIRWPGTDSGNGDYMIGNYNSYDYKENYLVLEHLVKSGLLPDGIINSYIIRKRLSIHISFQDSEHIIPILCINKISGSIAIDLDRHIDDSVPDKGELRATLINNYHSTEWSKEYLPTKDYIICKEL